MAGFVQAVAVDLDGTIAHGPELDAGAVAALDDCRVAGTSTILVTGRIESELARDFPDLLSHFDVAVLENGAVLAVDDRRDVLASVDPLLAPYLRDRQVPLREGAAIIACRDADAPVVLDGIEELGLDAQLVHNRSELMVLPAGISKGTGMRAALSELGISIHNSIAIGDAENDLSMLTAAEIGVAAAGSVESVRRIADIVIPDEDLSGLADFLNGPVVSGVQPVRSGRRDLRIGRAPDGTVVSIPGAQAGILVCGGSGTGKSHLAGLMVERWIGAGYSVLVIDPEGDHSTLAGLRRTVVIDADGAQSVDELMQLLEQRSLSVVLDLSGMTPSKTVAYLETVAPAVESIRRRSGVPHWIVVDEAHGALAEDGTLANVFRPNGGGYCYVTYHPELLCAAVKNTVDVTLTALGPAGDREGDTADTMIRIPGHPNREFVLDPRLTSHVRHRNKYRDIELPERLRFRFRDQAGNVVATAATVAGLVSNIRSVPDESITHHVLRGDFSRWAVGAVQDRALGAMLAAVENDCSARISAAVSTFRRRAGAQLEQRYGVDSAAPRSSGGRG